MVHGTPGLEWPGAKALEKSVKLALAQVRGLPEKVAKAKPKKKGWLSSNCVG